MFDTVSGKYALKKREQVCERDTTGMIFLFIFCTGYSYEKYSGFNILTNNRFSDKDWFWFGFVLLFY